MVMLIASEQSVSREHVLSPTLPVSAKVVSLNALDFYGVPLSLELFRYHISSIE
jgi:hypothetical protein